MKSLPEKIKQNFPPYILFFVVFVLFLTNYLPNTFLTGWDNLHPEYNFEVNIKRSIFAVWQEYQGLGLLGGMGHASDLLRQIFLYLISPIFPIPFLRYFWTFLMLFLGPLGAYYLIKLILEKNQQEGGDLDLRDEWMFERLKGESSLASKDESPTDSNLSSSILPLMASLFYLLNLSTLQIFYVPFEAFITHFAALPWLLLTSINYLHNTKKSLIFLILVLFLSTPSAYIPTIFVAYLMTMGIYTIIYLAYVKKNYSPLKRVFKLFSIIFLINSFWLLPFIYFTLTSSSVNLNAKINQMATETIFLQNKEAGNINNVILLKGFLFNNVDPNKNGEFSYMMNQWRNHLANPVISIIGYFFFVIILLGFLKSIQTKKPVFLFFAVLFIFSFTMLTTDTPPFSWINIFFRNYIPLFNQAFRFPFTKFLSLASLSYSILFAIGIYQIKQWLEKLKIIFILFTTLLIIFIFPIFQGKLFYDKERLDVPKEYFEVFDFFKQQNPNTRIANFPITSYYGWSFYNFNYGGSGFLWYGIKQPILDRAFDVWSKTDENYYYEISNALYSKNPVSFENVLNKYQINFLLVDKNIISPFSPKALFTKELKEIISKLPAVKNEVSFGNIDIYKVKLKDNPSNFIFLADNLPSLNSYDWGNNDQAYFNHGNYTSVNDQQPVVNDYSYPFRSLFSLKTQKEIEYKIKENSDAVEFNQTLPASASETTLQIPSLLQTENILPMDIILNEDQENNFVINANIKSPQLFINNEKVFEANILKPLFKLPKKLDYPLNLNINGVVNLRILSQTGKVATTFISLKQDNIFTLVSSKKQSLGNINITSQFLNSQEVFKNRKIALNSTNKEKTLIVKIPKILDNYFGFNLDPTLSKQEIKNCDNFRKGLIENYISIFKDNNFLTLSSKNAAACLSFYVPSLSSREAYTIFIQGQNITGRSLHFWVLDEDQKNPFIDTFLSSSKDHSIDSYILSPQDNFGKAYSLHFENISIGQDQAINNLGEISGFPIPYNFLTSLVLTANDQQQPVINDQQPVINVSHPNESLYVISLNKETIEQFNNETIVLSQSFDKGWRAYQAKNYESGIMNYASIYFPFVFGNEIKEHVLVNNWENGWNINNSKFKIQNSKLVIIYLPQYLEYFGFVLLIGTLLWIIFYSFKK